MSSPIAPGTPHTNAICKTDDQHTALGALRIFAIIILGLTHPPPIAIIGAPQSLQPVEALSVILTLKAFAAGCSALTGGTIWSQRKDTIVSWADGIIGDGWR